MASSYNSSDFTEDHSFIQTLLGTLGALLVLYFGNAGLTLTGHSSGLSETEACATNGSLGTESLVDSAMNPSLSGESEGSSAKSSLDCSNENFGETAMIALSSALSAGGGGFIVIIGKKDAVPYSKVEHNASKLYESVQRRVEHDSLHFPAIVAGSPEAMKAMQAVFGSCSVDRIEDTLAVLELLANEQVPQ